MSQVLALVDCFSEVVDRRFRRRLRARAQGEPPEAARRRGQALQLAARERIRRRKLPPRQTREKGHGRVEHRYYYQSPLPDSITSLARG